MNHKTFFVPLILVLILAGCALPTGGPGPRTWIDAPLDGSTVELGPVVVRSHAASNGGTAQAALLVNGLQVRVDQAGDPSAALIEFNQTWSAAQPGVYVLQVISTDKAGNEGRSNTVRVQVGGSSTPNNSTPETASTLTATSTTVTEATITVTPVITPTATLVSEPTFTFTSAANCRKGDSTAYDVVTSFLPNDQVRIEGRNADSSWFRVSIPSGGSCWVSSVTGTPGGPYGSVQVVAAPPLPPTDTPAPVQPPAAPGNFRFAPEVCNANEYKVTLQWNNVPGEDGYRVYRDGQLIATLRSNRTTFTDAPPDYKAHTYGVESFNDAGASARLTIQEDGCLF